MKIAIFDDIENEAVFLKEMIFSWSRIHHRTGVVICIYTDIAVLKHDIDEGSLHDVFFLDIMTKESNSTGFRMAEYIRLNNTRAIIVFTTNSKEYMESAFEISTFRYLIKPLKKEKIYAVLDHINDMLSSHNLPAAVFQGEDSKLIVPYTKIVYIETVIRTHRVILHLTDGSAQSVSTAARSFSDLACELSSKDFLRCHKSYIINLNFLTGYDHSNAIMSYTDKIPIGRDYRMDFFNEILRFNKLL